MPEHRSTVSAIESPYPDAEDWQNVFEVYAERPDLAFSLAHQLIVIEKFLQGGRKWIPEALALLDLAVDTLYTHTQFRVVSHELFRAAIEGRISTEQEKSLRDLGISI